MSIPFLILFLAIGLSFAMLLAWRVAEQTGKNGWIDAIWSFATAAACVIAALWPIAGHEGTMRQNMVTAMSAIWGLRLGLHITWRVVSGSGDDPRYARLREEWGHNSSLKLFLFLQIQAASGLLLAICVLAAAHNPAPYLRLIDCIGVVVLLIAILGEMIADRQLRNFGANSANKHKVCDIGLWRFSRHPNYFFEWLGWVAYALIAIDFTGRYSFGWVALAGPIFMYWLLVHVSGIPPLEAHMLRSRGGAFRDYQTRVNAFWPGPSRAKSFASHSGGSA